MKTKPHIPVPGATSTPGAAESPASNETFPHRTDHPGEAGLANEARPGLGTRVDREGAAERVAKANPPAMDADPQGRNKPIVRPAPREQASDSRAQAIERDTSASGRAGV